MIDFHTHFFPDDLAPRAIEKLIVNAAPNIAMKNYTDGTAAGLLQSARNANIDLCVTLAVATKPSQVRTINTGCANNPHKEFIQFGSLHPDCENIEEEIDYLTKCGLKGIKLHPEYQSFYIDDKKFFPMYEQLSAANIIVLFHSGKDPGPFTNDHVLPPSLLNVHKNFPKLKMVAAHLGGWMVWDDVENLLAQKVNFHFDTSAIYGLISPEQFLRICRKHGCEKIIFGSDCPWYDQAESVRWLERSGLTSGELEIIFDANGRQLLGL